MHGSVHQQGQGGSAPDRGREESHHLGAGRQGCRCHDRVRRKPQHAQGVAHRHLQRQLHDQLPCADGEGPQRPHWRGQWIDDHHPRVHQRPGAYRRLSHRPAARAFRDHVHDPDQDRSSRGGGTRAAGTERQAGRLRHARADHQRVHRRSGFRCKARDHRRGSEQRSEAGVRSRAQGHPRIQQGPTGVRGLQPQSGLVGVRFDSYQGFGRNAGQGVLLV